MKPEAKKKENERNVHWTLQFHISTVLVTGSYSYFILDSTASPLAIVSRSDRVMYGQCCDIGQTCIGKDVKMTYFLE